MTFLKAHWLSVLLIVGGWLYVRRRALARKAADNSGFSGWRPGPAIDEAMDKARAAGEAARTALEAIVPLDAAVDTNPANVTIPDQTKYPGWRQSGDGIWFNPSTGEHYSRGTSPPAVLPSAYDTGEMVRTDLTDAVDAIGQAYIDNPPKEEFPDAVIF